MVWSVGLGDVAGKRSFWDHCCVFFARARSLETLRVRLAQEMVGLGWHALVAQWRTLAGMYKTSSPIRV